MIPRILCFLTIALAAIPAQAGGRRCNARVNFSSSFNSHFHHNGFIQQAFAVPVAVPVARQSYVNYSAQLGGNQVGYGIYQAPQMPAAQVTYQASYGAAPVQAVQAQPQAGYQYSVNYQAGYGAANGQAAASCPPCPACPPNQPAPAQPGAQALTAPAPQPTPAPPQSLVQQKCMGCHSGANAKGNLDLTGPLTCEQRLAAINAVVTGKMPKDAPLGAEQMALLQELSRQ